MTIVAPSGMSVTSGNVGIGTTMLTTSALSVMNGNVGIGTWVPGGSLIVKGGNVGIGSNVPGQALDVIGTVRATAFIGNGAGLTGLAPSQWTTTNTNDVYLPNNGNVGLGTTITAGGALLVMNGNVGIGTWVPSAALVVRGSTSASGNPITSFRSSNGVSSSIDITDSGIIQAGFNSGGGLRLAISDGGPINIIGLTDAGFAYSTPAGTQVKFDANGNVGVGTTTPVGGMSIMNGNVGIGTWVPVSTLSVVGSLSVTTVTKSANYTASSSDNVILVSTSGGAVTITLPAVGSVPGREYVIKKTDNSGNVVTIQGNGTDNIDGNNTATVSIQYQTLTIVSDGSSWDII